MWPALAILAAGAFAKYQANKGAEKEREQFANAMEAYQRTKAGEGEAATEALLQKQTPVARGTELAETTAARDQSLRDTVGAAQAFDAAPVAGKGSADYRTAQEANASAIAERTRRAIEQLATMGAPGEQQHRFGLRFGRAAGTVDSANNSAASVGRGYMTDINNVRPDAFLSTAGDIGMAVGGGMLAGPAGAAGGAVNNGQGFQDASGNLYDDSVASPEDDRIRRELALKRGFQSYFTPQAQQGAQR